MDPNLTALIKMSIMGSTRKNKSHRPSPIKKAAEGFSLLKVLQLVAFLLYPKRMNMTPQQQNF